MFETCMVFEKFTFVNYLDFVQYQKFSNEKAEKSFKELFYRIVETSESFDSCEAFVLENIQRERNQIKEQIPVEIQNSPDKKLAKAIKKHLFGNKVDYTLLLYFELMLFCITVKINGKNVLEKIWDDFDYSEKRKNKIWLQITNLDEIKNRRIKASFNDVIVFIESQKKYDRQNVFNIAVCATMSAGKSTFVNALLGNDYLPARNEATTAKITSVYDNDVQKKMIGFAAKAENVLYISDNLQLSDIDKWNADNAVEHIYLQADLDSICSDKIICAIHDTPGTNNSADSNHHAVTIDFLEQNEVDMIIFVANATQLKTTDEHTLLTEIYKKIVSKKNIHVLFVLNKADALDPEKEDLNEIIQAYKAYVDEIGYRNAGVMPVSAKAARLFKMALKGNANHFTHKEYTEFCIELNLFKDYLDFGSGNKNNFDKNEVMTINNTEYALKSIHNALECTGLPQIEHYIENLF